MSAAGHPSHMPLGELRVKVRTPATLLGLLLSLAGYWLLADALYLVYHSLGGPRTAWSTLIYTASQAIGLALLLLVLRGEGNGFDTVWFGRGGRGDLAYALAFLVLAWAVWGALDALGAALGVPEVRWRERWPVAAPLDLVPIAVFSLSAAFFEEVFFRGYAITRLYSLTGNVVLASAVSVACFTALHHVFGPRVMLCILGWGTVDTLLFLHRRSTKASFYFHFMNNAIVYVLFQGLSLLA